MSTDFGNRFDAYEKGDYLEVCPSDHLMDRREISVKFTPKLIGSFDESTNNWPKKCEHCWLDDVDNPPSPYLLGRRIDRPVEFDVADLGNFFVKDRVRRAIELVFPGQCVFHPTFAAKSKQPTPWFLGVPVATVNDSTPREEGTQPRCAVCGRLKYVGRQWYDLPLTLGADFAKSHVFYPGETWEDRWEAVTKINKLPRRPHTSRWTHMDYYRELYVSVRAEFLFKKMGVKGLIRTLGFINQPTPADKDWVNQQMKRLAELGLAERAAESPNDANLKWFSAYLKKNGRKKTVPVDFTAIEAQMGKPLPDSYKEFMTKIGRKKYENLDTTDGFDAEIIDPGEIDPTSYRAGTLEVSDDESALVDGVMFATTGHGDVFCFDLAAAGHDYPVYHFEHDLNGYSVFAPNFVACLRRFVEQD